MVRPLLVVERMNRLVAALAVSSTLMSGCGWMIQDAFCGGENRSGCGGPSTTIIHEDDDDTGMGIAIAGAVIGTALIVAMISKSSRDDDKPSLARPTVAPETVAVTAPPPSGDDREQLLQRMYVQGYLSATTGTCEATIAIGKRLSTMSPSYHDRYAADPTIATCLRH